MNEFTNIDAGKNSFLATMSNEKCEVIYCELLHRKCRCVGNVDYEVEFLCYNEKLQIGVVVGLQNQVAVINIATSEVKYNWNISSQARDVKISVSGELYVYFSKVLHIYELDGELLRKLKMQGSFNVALNSGCYIEKNDKSYFLSNNGDFHFVCDDSVVGDAYETLEFKLFRLFRDDIIVVDQKYNLVKRISVGGNQVVIGLGCYDNRFVSAYMYSNTNVDDIVLLTYDLQTDELKFTRCPWIGFLSFCEEARVFIGSEMKTISIDGEVLTIGEDI